jgi:hypothetical protein
LRRQQAEGAPNCPYSPPTTRFGRQRTDVGGMPASSTMYTVIHDRGAWSRTLISELVRDEDTPSSVASRPQNHATNALTYDMNPSTLGATNACSRRPNVAQSSQNVHARTSPPVMRIGCRAAWTEDHIAERCASGATTSQRG